MFFKMEEQGLSESAAGAFSTLVAESESTEEIEFFGSTSSKGGGGSVPLNIQSTGEIISTLFEASTTRTAHEREAIRTIAYGDLPKHQRATRSMEESCWTSNKQHISQDYGPALFSEAADADRFIILGTNAIACYALEETTVASDGGGGGSIKQFKKDMVEVEHAALYHTFRFRMRHLNTVRESEDMLTEVIKMGKLDATMKPVVARIGKDLTKKIHKLRKKEVETDGSLPIQKRPGNAFPTISCMLYEFGMEEPAPAEQEHPAESALKEVAAEQHELVHIADPLKESAAEQPPPVDTLPAAPAPQEQHHEFRLWTVCATKDKAWIHCKMDVIRVFPGTIPNVAFNQTHLVIMYQPPGAYYITVDLYELTTMGRPKRKRCDQFHLVFPKKHFIDEGGLVKISLSDHGIVCITYLSGLIVFDALRKIEKPRVIVLDSEYRRILTCAKGTIRGNADGKSSTRGSLIMGTHVGECFGVNWESGEIEFTELTPATEHVLSAVRSNGRTIMQTVLAISGRFSSDERDPPVHLPTSRCLGLSVCGTLIFMLEKYGAVHVYSTTTRSIVFPFNAPKGLEVGLGYASLPIYDCICARPEEVVVVYANGVSRNFAIRASTRNLIEKAAKGKLKKNKK